MLDEILRFAQNDMFITAKLKHLRISPRKVRLVTDLVRGLSVEEAEKQLKFLTKRSAEPILKLLNSAVANAQNVYNLAKNDLEIAKILVDPGPTLKRWIPRAMGRATPIMKRTSHITLVLEPKKGVTVEKKKVEEKPVKKIIEDKEKPATKEEDTGLLEEIVRPVEKKEDDKELVDKPKSIVPPKPYQTASRSKKKFFSRQTFGNAKKLFRRKSI